MTGFARATATIAQGTLSWEIRGVNSKGLDLRLRVPSGLDGEEAGFRARIAGTAKRGAVQATLTLQRAAAAPEVRIDTGLRRRLIEAARAAVPEGGTVVPPTMDGLLAVRGVVEVVERAETAHHRATLLAAHQQLETALAGFDAARREEGAGLGRVLLGQLQAVEGLACAARDAPGRRPEAVLARLRKVVAALGDTGLDPDRLHAEAVLMAARADVSEEIDRLFIHAAAAREALEGGGVVGRRLDFLAQEMAREANTLGAKSADAGLTATSLDLRTVIEQFREQVQNLE